MITVSPWIKDVFEHYLICEFTTISDGKPITFPLLYFYDPTTGIFSVTSSILFSRKIEHMKKNSKVSLLFSNPEGSGIGKHAVLVQGIAKCEDADLRFPRGTGKVRLVLEENSGSGSTLESHGLERR